MPRQSAGAEIVRADAGQILRAARRINHGDIVAYPTETSYGLAVLACDAAAVARLAQLKGRTATQYFSVVVADAGMLREVVRRVPGVAEPLIEAHWPGPLTLVLPATPQLPPALVNPQGGVGVRCTSDAVAAQLVRAVGRAITATSANRSGEPAATEARAAAIAGVALVLDDGPRTAPASTVIQVLDEELVVLRRGPVRP